MWCADCKRQVSASQPVVEGVRLAFALHKGNTRELRRPVRAVKPEALGKITRDARELGEALERARARAILLHFFSKEWSGNDALKLLESGEWPPEVKP
jgi:hypothetical protein